MERNKLSALIRIGIVILIGMVACVYIKYESDLRSGQYVANNKSDNLKKTPISAQNIVGNDKDEHGCIGSAGYTWCEAKNKCLRSWEEECGQNDSSKNVSDNISQNRGLQEGVNIKSNKVYFYNKEKGSINGKNINIKLGDGYISFDGDLTKVSFYPFEDTGNTGFFYNNLEISSRFACPYAVCSDNSKVTYGCDGPLVSVKDGLAAKWEYCQTDKKDYLSQFEFSPANGTGFATGGPVSYSWYKLYIRKFGNTNLFLFGNLGESFDYPDETDKTKINTLSSKEYLDEFLQKEENKKLIKEWDDFVQNIKFQ